MTLGSSRTVGLVVFPGFELLDLSGPLCALNLSTRIKRASYLTAVYTARGGPVVSCSGVPIDTLKATPDENHLDTLLIVGGPAECPLEGDAETVELIKDLAPLARRVASVCTGAFLLAAAGLLDGRVATTHWRYAAELQRRFPKVRVSADQIFARDGNIWTSAGITSGIDLTLALIEDDFGIDASKAVAREMVVYHRRSGGQSQFSTMLELEPPSDRVRDALKFAREHLHEPPRGSAPVNSPVCFSRRQATRLRGPSSACGPRWPFHACRRGSSRSKSSRATSGSAIRSGCAGPSCACTAIRRAHCGERLTCDGW